MQNSPGRPVTIHVSPQIVAQAIAAGLQQRIGELEQHQGQFLPIELTNLRRGWLRRCDIRGYPDRVYARRKWCAVIRQMESDGLLRTDGTAVQLMQAGRELAGADR